MGKLTEKELIDKLKKVSESFITDDPILEKGFKKGVLIALEVVKNNVDLADVSVSLEEKTERLALEAYPVQMGNVCDEDDWDYNEQYRDCWIEGFNKANSR